MSRGRSSHVCSVLARDHHVCCHWWAITACFLFSTFVSPVFSDHPCCAIGAYATTSWRGIVGSAYHCILFPSWTARFVVGLFSLWRPPFAVSPVRLFILAATVCRVIGPSVLYWVISWCCVTGVSVCSVLFITAFSVLFLVWVFLFCICVYSVCSFILFEHFLTLFWIFISWKVRGRYAENDSLSRDVFSVLIFSFVVRFWRMTVRRL